MTTEITVPESAEFVPNRFCRLSLVISMVLFALLLLACCGWAKSLFLEVFISGAVNPTSRANSLPGLICGGFAYSAPMQAAFLFVFLPFRFFVRMVIAAGWVAIVLSVFDWGNRVHPYMDRPLIFSDQAIFSLPLFSLGVFFSLSIIKQYQGWELGFSRSPGRTVERRFTFASMIMLTSLVAAALCPLQMIPGGIGIPGLLILPLGMVCGLIAASNIRLLMSVHSLATGLLFLLMAFLSFLTLQQIMYAGGAGGLALGNGILFSSDLLSSFSGFVILRIHGVCLRKKI